MSNASLSRTEIFQAVADILSDRLAIPKDKIGIDTGLIYELGIDSLDFLDMVFCLERRFGIKIRDSDFNKLLRGENLGGTDVEQAMSDEDLEALAVYIPKLRTHGFESSPTIPELWSCVTVESLVILVQQRLSAGSSEG